MIPFIFFMTAVFCQSPGREFRAVWVATVDNIDWPSEPGLSTMEQMDEMFSILDLHKKNGINAIILQIRPTADALYSSPLEPWSVYLTGEQGKPPDPWYDPLETWITEAHKRGMELHAWLNPYRIKLEPEDSLVEEHIYKLHPDWGWTYGTRIYFEPGNPQVREFVTSVVLDIVRRYDVDAIHFDDYFYPYRIPDQEIPDSAAFEKYGGTFFPDQKDDWRRHNVDTIIRMLSAAIKSEKPWVKFGISPFGIWRNRAQDPGGSETGAGTTNYDDLYADVIKWQREGLIDYLMPQLYWRDDHPAADFSTLAYWWNDYNYGRGMYIGLAPYRISKSSDYKLWKKDKYFLRQIDLIRSLKGIDGYGFFSSRHFFREDLKSLNKKLQKKYCPYPSIVPAMPWIDRDPPAAPVDLQAEGTSITWDVINADNEMDKARFFAVYYYKARANRYLKSSDKIIAIIGENQLSFEGSIPNGVYRVSALDRINNESQLSNVLIIE